MIIAKRGHNQNVLILDRHRPKSSLSRGGARTPSTTVKSIEEMDENAPEEAQTDKPAPSGEDKAPVDEQSLKVTEDALKEVSTIVVYFFAYSYLTHNTAMYTQLIHIQIDSISVY